VFGRIVGGTDACPTRARAGARTLDLNSYGPFTDHQLVMARRAKQYVVSVTDAEGITREYVCLWKSSRRRAKAEAQSYWGVHWGATRVEVRRAYEAASGRLVDVRRLLTVAGVTFVVSGVAIAALMFIALSLEGAV
jgi:hypothetical protein